MEENLGFDFLFKKARVVEIIIFYMNILWPAIKMPQLSPLQFMWSTMAATCWFTSGFYQVGSIFTQVSVQTFFIIF